MKENLIEVLNPIGRVASLDSRIAHRLQDMNMKTMGIIDNQKVNANIILYTLKNNLSCRYSFKEIFYFEKKKPSEPADFIDEIAEKCDFVINGIGH